MKLALVASVVLSWLTVIVIGIQMWILWIAKYGWTGVVIFLIACFAGNASTFYVMNRIS